jgi:hypothetical protein
MEVGDIRFYEARWEAVEGGCGERHLVNEQLGTQNIRQRILISLIWSKDRFTMSIADDGTGFDPLSAQTALHYDLMMRELEKTLPGKL